MRALLSAIALIALIALLPGCSTPGSSISPLMTRLGPDAHTPVPLYGRAVVVFMRPTEDNSLTQSTVYEVASDGDHFVGVVSASSKVAYMTPAGKSLFMVVGESADFMYAELAEGKTYYVLVDPRVGWWKSRFSLLPVRKAQIGSPEFQQWDTVDLLVPGPDCEQWVRDNVNSIVEKRNHYLPDWNRESQAARRSAGLHAEDGYP
jgi:hypothetical protein